MSAINDSVTAPGRRIRSRAASSSVMLWATERRHDAPMSRSRCAARSKAMRTRCGRTRRRCDASPDDELPGGAQDRRVEPRGGQVELERAVFGEDLLHSTPRDDDRRLSVFDEVKKSVEASWTRFTSAAREPEVWRAYECTSPVALVA